ncbi:MFS transporter [Mechercharimyces sp. CAU 1602]|uniref:MFS transporter n=1 Tax=Mechercharimyces sp. CAU 1602 TaxID=2973933 RepID=UPI002161E3E6|nr:MFS transporter [Mechercharimyces sp. CAU 1602]MCS1350919.1 MFS transporter [Mechercharimyces sp. CAU 1602]
MSNQLWLTNRFFLFFFTWGVFLPHWTVYLTSRGLTVSEAGIMISAGLVVRSFSNLYLFPLLSGYFTLARISLIIPFSAVAVLGLYPWADGFSSLMVVTIIFSMVYPVLLPMNETVASLLLKEKKVVYGSSRLWGSVGFMMALIVCGGLISLYGDRIIFTVMTISCLLLGVMTSFSIPTLLYKKMERRSLSPFTLFRSSTFITCLSICILLQGAHAVYYSFGFLYLQNIGMGGTVIGLILMLAVCSEVIFFFVADRWFKPLSIPTLFMIALVASILRWMLIFLFPHPAVFIFTQMFHALTFGLTHFTFIRYIDDEIEAEWISLAQGVYAALATSLGTGVLTIVGSVLYEYSPGVSFLGMAIVVLPGLILVPVLRAQLKAKAAITQQCAVEL